MEERHPRKLAVILHADVVGSTALVQQDEGLAHARIREAFGRLSSTITVYNGTTHEIRGDALVAEFDRASDAVEAALAFQEENARINSSMSDGIQPTLRIGISLGEVVFADNTVTGEGVVLAQRLEQLAEPGGICIQGAIHEAVPGRLPFAYESLGEQTLKGFTEPVRPYRVTLKSGETIPAPEPHLRSFKARSNLSKARRITIAAIACLVIAGGVIAWLSPWRPIEEAASVEQMAFPLPSEPSIAVMPFDNMSGDSAQDAIADGFTEGLITTLAQMPELFVIARNSTFAYKDKPVKVKQVAEELGVRYVLEGSIQKEGQTLRVNAQLIDALTGHHLWANKYDRDVNAMFAVQDELVRKIFTALQVKLTAGEHGRVWQQGTDNFEAYLTWLEGWKHFRSPGKDENAIARQLILKAIDMDPDWAMPYTTVTWTHWKDIFNGWTDTPEESLKLAEENAQKALVLDETYPGVHAALGAVEELKGNRHQAIAHHNKAVALGPNISVYQAILASNLNWAGKPNEAIALVKKAMRLEPTYQPWYLGTLGDAYTSAGKYEDAVEAYEQLLERRPESTSAIAGLIVNYIWLGQENKARSLAQKLMDIEPTFTLSEHRKRLKYEDAEFVERQLDALRKADLADNPALSFPDKPSIAVMPFNNMSGDPEQEYFADGMSEDLITDLSKITGMLVIARNSTFAYKGKSVDARQISRELGVNFVLEGSVRRVGNRVRINAQLIDGNTGGHLWADRYDGELDDVFALQDKVTNQVIQQLAVVLTPADKARRGKSDIKNPDAYDAFLRGWQHYLLRTPEHYVKARDYFLKAIETDPNFSRAHAALASVYWKGYFNGWYPALQIDRDSARNVAREHLDKAMANPTSLAHQVAAYMNLWRGRWQASVAEGSQAIERDPNDADSKVTLAEIYIYVGKPNAALKLIAKAGRIDPHHQGYHSFLNGLARFGMEQFDAAADALERALELNPDLWLAREEFGPQSCEPCILLAATYAYLDRKSKADVLVQRIREHYSGHNVQTVTAFWPYQHEVDRQRLAQGLIKAGLPETLSDIQ